MVLLAAVTLLLSSTTEHLAPVGQPTAPTDELLPLFLLDLYVACLWEPAIPMGMLYDAVCLWKGCHSVYNLGLTSWVSINREW